MKYSIPPNLISRRAGVADVNFKKSYFTLFGLGVCWGTSWNVYAPLVWSVSSFIWFQNYNIYRTV